MSPWYRLWIQARHLAAELLISLALEIIPKDDEGIKFLIAIDPWVCDRKRL